MFKIAHKPDNIDILFSADLKNIDRAARETKRFLGEAGINNQSFNIILCMREALINAVIHGCAGRTDKTVTYNLKLKNGCLVMRITDGGSGFNWRSSMAKALPAAGSSGRGLLIMKKYFKTVQYNKKGNQITLTKKINPQPAA